MDKSKLISLGERLKTQGAQMGRMMSTKMKDLLQSPTTESKIVDDATLETLPDSNWGLNLRICSMINSEELNGTEVVRSIRRKLSGRNRTVVHRLSLELLEACAMNCDKVFSEIASEKVVEEMLRMLDDVQVDSQIKNRIWELIRAWGESEDLAYLPVFRQTYMSLKARIPPTLEDRNSLSMESSISNTNQSSLPYDYGILSAEEKHEFLIVTRNNLEVLASLLNSETNKNQTEDELVVGMKENCKNSVPTLQRIIQSTDNDEGMLFEALNVLDEIQGLISRCEGQSAEHNPNPNSPLQPHEEEDDESSKLVKVSVGARIPGTSIGGSSENCKEGV